MKWPEYIGYLSLHFLAVFPLISRIGERRILLVRSLNKRPTRKKAVIHVSTENSEYSTSLLDSHIKVANGFVCNEFLSLTAAERLSSMEVPIRILAIDACLICVYCTL